MTVDGPGATAGIVIRRLGGIDSSSASGEAERIAMARWNAAADHWNQWGELGDDERAELIARATGWIPAHPAMG